MKKLFIAAVALFVTVFTARADEGMWLLPFVKDLNIKDMQKKGFKLSAEQIYSLNQNALKDAIVIFGGGCTGEIISPEGLVLTNHHCGYGTIQSHSTVEHDYLKNGFWAKTKEQEIPSPGLGVIFVRKIEDVTARVLEGVTDKMTEQERAAKIRENILQIVTKNTNKEENLTANVSSMFGGNQYLMFINERFGDVRFVGAPPSSIGKFGGETDNWMWPRHTGDFSLFRVYANGENKSTDNYEKTNKPYQPKEHLKVSLKGYKEGDYAMIMGFPGRTNRYMTTWEIDQTLEQDNPIRIYVRGERQKLMWEDMIASDEVRIKYANKYAGSSNYWKNSIGMSRGLKKLDVRSKKQAEQDVFVAWVNADPSRKAKYGDALVLIEEAVKGRRPAARELQYISEALMNVESFQLASRANAILNQKMAPEKQKEELLKAGEAFFKNYNQSTDRKITPKLLEIFVADSKSPLINQMQGLNATQLTKEIFDNSVFVDQDKYNAWVATLSNIDSDPAIMAVRAIMARGGELSQGQAEYNQKFAEGHRKYLAGLLEMNKGKKSMYPDANFTMRMTYGQVLPYWAADAVFYNYYTTLGGVVAKRNNDDPEFVVPDKLVELWKSKDFGQYAVNGDVPVALLSNNDITGGNSGSPVMNGKGELIGLAFDGNWEAMSGDIAFEPELQRTISVDIRYVLFIIDKFAGANNLIQEMTIVK